MPDTIEKPWHNSGSNYDVVLAEIKQTMTYMSRDINDLKITQAKQLDRLSERVEILQNWKAGIDGSIKLITRAQAILYVVFSAGFILGIYISLHR